MKKIVFVLLFSMTAYSSMSAAKTTVCKNDQFKYSISDEENTLEIEQLETGKKLLFSTKDHGQSGEVKAVLSFIDYGNGDSDWNLMLRFGGSLQLSFEHEEAMTGEMNLNMNKDLFPGMITESLKWSDQINIESSTCTYR